MITNIKNALRTLLGIRAERQQPPSGPMPLVGSNIVRGKARIRLQHPISKTEWDCLSIYGWRTVDMRTDRRRYLLVPEEAVTKLLNADGPKREELNFRLLAWAELHSFDKKPNNANKKFTGFGTRAYPHM